MAKNKTKNRYSLFQLPEELENMTIGELVRSYDEVYSKNGKTSIKRQFDVGEINLEMNFSSEEVADSENEQKNKINSKKDYWEEISEMLSQNMRQKDIAEKLGVSASYVSQIIKKNQ